MTKLSLIIATCLAALPALADEAKVEAVKATQSGAGWRFDVTLSHPDSGWDHYADGWRVLDTNGNELGLRVLAHPHVHEQPFTRSLSGVVIPAGTTEVFIQTRCVIDGWGSKHVLVPLDK